MDECEERTYKYVTKDENIIFALIRAKDEKEREKRLRRQRVAVI